MAMTNKYPGRCVRCASTVAAGEGICKRSRKTGRHYVRHRHGECEETRQDDGVTQNHRIDDFNIGGKEYPRNARGRCEDAPCCGCCTI